MTTTLATGTIEVFDNEDGSYYALCPICGASCLAWDSHGAAHEIMSHLENEHELEEV